MSRIFFQDSVIVEFQRLEIVRALIPGETADGTIALLNGHILLLKHF